MDGHCAHVFAPDPDRPWLQDRTRRSLAAAGFAVAPHFSPAGGGGPWLLVRAGFWLARPHPRPWPSLGDRIALGTTAGPAWDRIMAKCGGAFGHLPVWHRRWPRLDAVWLPESTARSLADDRPLDGDLDEALRRLVRRGTGRPVHLPAISGHFDPRLRVVQVVTTLQTGGAEKITLDLAAELNRRGCPTAVVTLGRGSRCSLPAPAAWCDLAEIGVSTDRRADAMRQVVHSWGADLVHSHLIGRRDARAWAELEVPMVMTVHNLPPGWPDGLATLERGEVDALFACSLAVEKALRDARVPVLQRTIWNGIVPAAFVSGSDRVRRRREWRESHGFAANDLLLLSLANPRAQKRLPLLIPLLQAVQALRSGQRVRLVLAGGPLDHPEVGATRDAAARLGLGDRLHWLGVVANPVAALQACDALVSLSAWEGLSLAHLEALAADLPVFATDVGGTAEIARHHPRLHLVPADDFHTAAAVIVGGLDAPPRPVPFPHGFTRHAMAGRAHWLYRRVWARRAHPAPTNGLVLVTNNFSTGGAQSSARRLLTALAARGHRVEAIVVEEDPRRPTPGHLALEAAGVPVTAIPPPGRADAADAVEQIAAIIDRHHPEAVVFWNLLTAYKIMLADGLMGPRVFDVSPGEMFFSSLDRYLSRPRPDLPCLSARDYGRRLTGAVVKYQAEAERARRVLGCPVEVIPNGIAVRSRPASPVRPNHRLTFATAARLAPDKRVEDLIAALRRAAPHLQPWQLLVAGADEPHAPGHARTLRRLAKGLPVRWLGRQPNTDDLLAQTDIFLMISEPAGCPNATLEALAAGVPVIATDVGGAGEQVIDNVTGRLVPARDDDRLARAIIELAGDPETRRRLGRQGAAHVASAFSLTTMIDRYESLFLGGDKPLAPDATPTMAAAR